MFKYVLNSFLGVSMRATFAFAVTLAVMYFSVYRQYLWGHKKPRGQLTPYCPSPVSSDLSDEEELIENRYQSVAEVLPTLDAALKEAFVDGNRQTPVIKIQDMDTYQRLHLTLSLYPYIIPLFLVYAAEYTMQAGTWTAIGFPITNAIARNEFYFAANWAYYAGVFISRSSGTLFTAPMWLLWLMPILQCANVGFFWIVAANQVFYNWWLLIGCFYTGLLGGAVYVHGFTRICKDLPKEHVEFALSATSVGECFGIFTADVCGLFLQSCLYAINGLPGAAVSCPFRLSPPI
jgi:battenin